MTSRQFGAFPPIRRARGRPLPARAPGQSTGGGLRFSLPTLITSATQASPDTTVRAPRARHAPWIAALALVVALVPLISAGRAHADPIDDKRAEAQQLQSEIDANGVQLDALSERYNGAQYRFEQAQAAAIDAQQKLDATTAEVARLRTLVNERGAELYRGAGQGPTSLDVSSANSLITSSKYGALAAKHDTKLLDELRRAERTLRDQQAQAEQAQADAQDEQRAITKAQAGVEAANAKQEQLLSQVNGEIAQLVAEERARKEAAALAAAQQRYVDAAAAAAAAPAPSPGNGTPTGTGTTPPTPTPTPAVVRAAVADWLPLPAPTSRSTGAARVRPSRTRGPSSASRIATPAPDPRASTARVSPCGLGARRA